VETKLITTALFAVIWGAIATLMDLNLALSLVVVAVAALLAYSVEVCLEERRNRVAGRSSESGPMLSEPKCSASA
jgi:hypothetical protein